MSKQDEMPDVIWADDGREYSTALYGPFQTQYRRIPALPDVMEDGKPLFTNGECWLSIGYHLGGLRFTAHYPYSDGSGFGEFRIPEGLLPLFGLLDPNETHHAQDGKIVRREG